jgi:DNA-binding SARP family transcriptional activator
MWFIEILQGVVRRDGIPVRLTAREFEVVAALALHGACPTSKLADVLYPEADFESARSLVKVYVHRIRRALGYDFLECVRGSYQLAEGARVDAIEIERALERALTSPAHESETRSLVLLELARRIRTIRSAEASTWNWFAAHAERFSELGRMFALRSARAALQGGDYERAIAIATQLGWEDPCDEQVREFVIKAYVRLGERGAAVREYRAYARTLRSELDLVPSSSLRDLMATGTGIV